MSGLSDHNPFVGPRPIQRGEALYGRKTEVRELHELLLARRVAVLHSPSGAGKSSLVQAGLIPRLKRGRFFDVWRPIRVNLDPAGVEGVPPGANRYLLSAMISLEDELPEARRRDPAELAALDFRTYLDTRPRRKARAKDSVVLLFNQFEEILSVDPRNLAAKSAFFDEVGAALDGGDYWALFIIREDYLAALTPYRDRIPTQLSNTYRLDLLGLEGAREAALRLSETAGRAFPAVDKLVRDLATVQTQQADGSFAREQGLYVEPVHLQVVCRRLWSAMPEDDLSIDDEDIEAYAGVSTSLAGYYADAVSAIAGGDAGPERAVRDWVGTKLIVGGIRSQVRREADASAGLDNRHIQSLLDSYLVRTEQRAGASWFELGHDRLVEPILADNEAWRGRHLHPLQVQAKLWEEGGREEALLLGAEALADAQAWVGDNEALVNEAERAFLDQSKRLRDREARVAMRQRVLMGGLVVFALAAAAAGVAARQSALEANRERGEALTAKEAADDARQDAEEAQAVAEDLRTKAEEARTEAEDARSQAQQALKTNERLARDVLRQMFQFAVRRFDPKEGEEIGGQLDSDERWTTVLEHGEYRFALASIVEGGGRLIVTGSDSVLAEPLFIEISAEWLLGDQARREVGILTQADGNAPQLESLRRGLAATGYVEVLDPTLERLSEDYDIGLLIVDNRWAPLEEAQLEAVEDFVRAGGGLLAVGDGAQWLAQAPREYQAEPSLDDYPMNQLLAPFGASWTEDRMRYEVLEVREDAAVSFTNEREGSVEIYWRSPSGRDEYFMTLGPGEERDIRTPLGRVWVVRADEVELGEAAIRYERQLVNVGETVETKKAPIKVRGGPGPTPNTGLPKTLSNAAMAKAKRKAEKASRECGKKHGSLIPSAKVKFEVSPAGVVTKADALAPMRGTVVGTCVAKAVSAQSFPKSESGVTKTWTLPL